MRDGALFILFSVILVLLRVQEVSAFRTQLHVHLDGAVSAQTLFEIAHSRNLSLPLVGRPKSVRAVELLIAANVGYESFAHRREVRATHDSGSSSASKPLTLSTTSLEVTRLRSRPQHLHLYRRGPTKTSRTSRYGTTLHAPRGVRTSPAM